MELIVDGKIFDTKKDIVPGSLEFENITPVTDEDFVKTIEFDKTVILNQSKSGDEDEK